MKLAAVLYGLLVGFVFFVPTALVAAAASSPSPAPTAAPTPQRVSLGMDIEVTNVDEPDANGRFHCEYLPPAQRVILGLPQRVTYWCAR